MNIKPINIKKNIPKRAHSPFAIKVPVSPSSFRSLKSTFSLWLGLVHFYFQTHTKLKLGVNNRKCTPFWCEPHIC